MTFVCKYTVMLWCACSIRNARFCPASCAEKKSAVTGTTSAIVGHQNFLLWGEMSFLYWININNAPYFVDRCVIPVSGHVDIRYRHIDQWCFLILLGDIWRCHEIPKHHQHQDTNTERPAKPDQREQRNTHTKTPPKHTHQQPPKHHPNITTKTPKPDHPNTTTKTPQPPNHHQQQHQKKVLEKCWGRAL